MVGSLLLWTVIPQTALASKRPEQVLKLFKLKPYGVQVNQSNNMTKFVINNGNFSASGAFSGYTAKGDRVHIFARQMESIGITKGDDLKGKFPFYVLGEKKDYAGRVDASGAKILNADGSWGIKDRLTATAIFNTIEELGQAFVDEATLDARVNAMVNQAVKSYSLDSASVDALANAF